MVIATRSPKTCSVSTKIHHGKKKGGGRGWGYSTVCPVRLCGCAELLRPSNKHHAHLPLDLQAVSVLPRIHRQLPPTHVGVTLKLLLQVLRRTRDDSDPTQRAPITPKQQPAGVLRSATNYDLVSLVSDSFLILNHAIHPTKVPRGAPQSART